MSFVRDNHHGAEESGGKGDLLKAIAQRITYFHHLTAHLTLPLDRVVRYLANPNDFTVDASGDDRNRLLRQ